MLRFEHEQKRCRDVQLLLWQSITGHFLGNEHTVQNVVKSQSLWGQTVLTKEGIINHTPPGDEGRSRLAIFQLANIIPHSRRLRQVVFLI
jgi:hypothetical protein